jgi:transcriptional regulator of acetoin/glycerol metabolism
LPPPAAEPPPPAASDAPAKEEILAVLARSGGNIAKLAAHYGKDRRQAYRWLKRYGIDPQSYR